MKYLITGGAGFIGSKLALSLLTQGHEVIVLDNLSTGTGRNLVPCERLKGFEFIKADLRHMVLNNLIGSVDVVFHLAATVGVALCAGDPIGTLDNNIEPTARLLRIASERRTAVFLASTSEVYGKGRQAAFRESDDCVYGNTKIGRWAYAYSKAVDEFAALAHHKRDGLHVVIGRFFNVTGDGQRAESGMVVPSMIERAVCDEPIVIHGDGSQVRCFADVHDVVAIMQALMLAPRANGRVVNIGNDEAFRIDEVAHGIRMRVSEATQRDPVPFRYLPYGSAFGADFEDIPYRVPDLALLKSLIESVPTRPLADTIDSMIYERITG